jgi:quercetin 2,3-dioxygenase
MIQVRKSEERGTFDHGWLVTRHTFSFASYRDLRYMGFSDLRVINEDDVAPGQGFGTHPHRDMEIVSYIVKGAIAHKDSMGNVTQIPAGEIQVMSAGTGVEHSEFNPSPTEAMKLLQIWIKPAEKDLPPSYGQKALDPERLKNRWELLVAPPGEGALTIHQDARVYASRISAGSAVDFALPKGRSAWVQIVYGKAALNGTALSEGDGAAVTDETKLSLTAASDAEALLFDLRGA